MGKMAFIPKLLLLVIIFEKTICAPLATTEIIEPENKLEKRSVDYQHNQNTIPTMHNSKNHYDRYHPTNKKDVFMSRGWGAGGMPFSVLYMGPTSSKAPMEQIYRPPMPLKIREKPQSHQQLQQHHEKIIPNKVVHLRNPIVGSFRRKGYPIIPQLFVSYGWGPAGK